MQQLNFRRAAMTLALTLAFVAPSAPVAAQVAVQGHGVQESDIALGAAHTSAILVQNSTTQPQAVRLYLTDYLYSADGTSRFDPPGTLPRSNANWIELSERELVVPPGSTVPISYTIHAPSDSSLRGSYWSVIMVEPVRASSATGLTASVRYGVQIISHVANAGQRHIAVRSGTLASDSAGAALDLVLANDGERASSFTVTTELFDAAGKVRARVHQERGITVPGSTLGHTVPLGNLEQGEYQAVVMVDAGRGAVTGAQYTIRLTP